MLNLVAAHTFREVISLLRNSRRNGTLTYSYRQLANKLGYRSPRTLAMVHKGQRQPSINLVRKVNQNFALSLDEQELVSLLAEKAVLKEDHIAKQIDEKILRIKKQICKAQVFEISNEEDELFFESEVFLTNEEKNIVREVLRNLLCEIKKKYSKCESDSDYFKFQISFRCRNEK